MKSIVLNQLKQEMIRQGSGDDKNVSDRLEIIITSCVFCLFIFGFSLTSIINCVFGTYKIATEEKRLLAPFPELHFNHLSSYKAFSSDFNSYFCDRFAYRNNLISDISLVRYKVFGSTKSSRVLIGKNGWLYYKDGVANHFLRNFPPLTISQLGHWLVMLEHNKQWLDQRHIKYLVFIAPNSSTIYPEYLPDRYRRPEFQTRSKQLIEGIRSFTDVSVVDVAPTLIAAKSCTCPYYKTDTHWNTTGAFLAAKPVIDQLRVWFPSIPPLKNTELNLVSDKFSGDLAGMLGLLCIVTENAFISNPKAHHEWKTNEELYDRQGEATFTKTFSTELDNKKLPTAVCLRDSFMISQREFFSNRFRKITYIWTLTFPKEQIEKLKPDVVIQEIAERNIARPD